MLELKGIRRTYGEVVALDDVSFEIAPGKIFGFLGSNGAGKTTTMRIIMGVAEPDAGEVLWNGSSVELDTRRHFGYMPEERGLYVRMHVRDQLVYLGRLRGLTKAAARAGTDSWLKRLELADRSGSRLQDLSHGNQQRIQLAAALVHEPDLLILDEPFSGLDPVGVATLTEILTDLATAGKTVVFSSHQLDLVEGICQDVAVIDHGRIVLSGSIKSLKASAGRRYLRIEISGTTNGWVKQITGVESSEIDGTSCRLVLTPGTDPLKLLDLVRKAGTVTDFSLESPKLSEIFIEAVRK